MSRKAATTAETKGRRISRKAAGPPRPTKRQIAKMRNQELAEACMKRAPKSKLQRRSKVRTDLAVAAKAISRFQSEGAVRSEAPTPERLRKARGTAKVMTMASATERMLGGKPMTVIVDRRVMRFEHGPVERLASKKLLDKNRHLNEILLTAANKYREKYDQAGIDTLMSADYLRPYVDGSRRPATGGAFEPYVSASKAMEPDEVRGAVDAIVLREDDLMQVGRKLSGYHGNQARASAVVLLRLGLRQLAKHFNLVP